MLPVADRYTARYRFSADISLTVSPVEGKLPAAAAYAVHPDPTADTAKGITVIA